METASAWLTWKRRVKSSRAACTNLDRERRLESTRATCACLGERGSSKRDLRRPGLRKARLEQPAPTWAEKGTSNRLEQPALPGPRKAPRIEPSYLNLPGPKTAPRIELGNLHLPGQKRALQIESGNLDLPGRKKAPRIETSSLRLPWPNCVHLETFSALETTYACLCQVMRIKTGITIHHAWINLVQTPTNNLLLITHIIIHRRI